jgi:hypothetical protein
MSSEIAFKPEDAVGLPSQIAFSLEEATVCRMERRRLQKENEKNIAMRFVCPRCGYGETGGPISVVVKVMDANTHKVHERRIPRQCRMCHTNMIKVNERRITRRWALRRSSRLLRE